MEALTVIWQTKRDAYSEDASFLSKLFVLDEANIRVIGFENYPMSRQTKKLGPLYDLKSELLPKDKVWVSHYLDAALVAHLKAEAGGRGYQTIIDESLLLREIRKEMRKLGKVTFRDALLFHRLAALLLE